MSDVTDISSIMLNSVLVQNVAAMLSTDDAKEINILDFASNDLATESAQGLVGNLPSVLDTETLTLLQNGGFGITLKDFTSISSYNTMMGALYGNQSANKFQTTLDIMFNTNSEEKLNNAKTFIEQMKANGMSNDTAVRTYSALQKYSLMTMVGNYNFVNASA